MTRIPISQNSLYLTMDIQTQRYWKPNLAPLRGIQKEHNIRFISKYNGTITFTHVQQLNQIDKAYCEEELCALNNRKVISCRIDRKDDLVDFRSIKNEDYIVKNWNAWINGILDLVDEVANLIHRER